MWKLLICSIISGTLYPCAQASFDLSIEDSIIYLREKTKQMDLLLKRTVERNEELSERLSEVEKVLEKERSTIERLEIKENLTRTLLATHIDSQREVQVLIQDNITSSAEKLRQHIQERSLGFENIESNFTNKMRSFENSLLKIEKDYARISNISKLDESLQNLDKTVRDGLQSIQTELYPRVKRLEEKRDLYDNVTAIENALRNHSSKISAFDTLTVDIQNSCYGEPPSLQNGAPMPFERKNNSTVRYVCDRKFVMIRNSTVRCKSGKWVGKPPVCRCKANTYGKSCDQTCPPCYNGGICHDLRGICICPDGFIGKNCEGTCPMGFRGPNCSIKCLTENCKNRLYCKMEPYGCSCARGFKGSKCEDSCEPGWYGADCKQQCNCLNGPHFCNSYTGVCDGGCDFGWTGETCQIKGRRNSAQELQRWEKKRQF